MSTVRFSGMWGHVDSNSEWHLHIAVKVELIWIKSCEEGQGWDVL